MLVLCCIPFQGALAKLQDADQDYLAQYESAVTSYGAGEYSTALVHLKNALQARPEHLPSRLLIGSTYMRLGQPEEAAKELRIALRLGAAPDQVIVPLGNALLLLRDYRGILDTIDATGLGGSRRYEVLVIRGRAHLELGELDQALGDFDEAMRVDDRGMEAYLGKAQVFSQRQDWETAGQLIDAARQRAPDSPEVWYELGMLQGARGDAKAALASYDRAIELNPSHMRARKARASALAQGGDFEKALVDAEFVRTNVPKDADAALTYGVVLMGLGRKEEADAAIRAALEQIDLIKDDVLKQQPGLLRVATLASMLRGNLEQANVYVDQYLRLKPQSVDMRKQSARIKLQLDEADAAIRDISPVVRALPEELDSLALLGQAYLQSGRYAEAQNMFERAAKQVPDSAALNTQLALARMGIGMPEEAEKDLGRAMKSDRANQTSAGLIKVFLHVRRGEYDKALATVDELLARQPGNPMMLNLRGVVYLNSRDFPKASEAFEAALKASPDFVPALYNLGMLAQQRGDIAAAAARYEQVLAINPNEVNALLGKADLALMQGQLEPALAPLLKAVTADPTNVDAHVRLISVYLNLGNTIEAQRQASAFQGQFPESGLAAEMVARVDQARGDNNAARNNYRNATRFTSFDGNALIRIAEEQMKLGDIEGARTALLKADDTPQRDQANSSLVRLHIRNKDLPAAWTHANKVREESPDSYLGDLLAGQIHMEEGDPAAALASFEAGFRKEKRPDLLFGMYQAMFALGKSREALALFEDWLRDHPRDVDVRRNLAVGYLSLGDQAKARRHLEKLVELAPNDAIGLSSLARIYQLGGDARARGLAERAVRSAPESSVALDTYGWILVTEGDAEQGLKYLREAVSRDSNPLMRYHLAQALNELGRTSEAKLELDTILRAKQLPGWADDARKLRDSL